jgi:hypothetical protein|tara:strand:+ start:22676 stop:22927 length:252 start_codon:yes stop_codon:yes gene_type:complete
MSKFRVIYEMDSDADTPREAALEVERLMNKMSYRPFFVVRDEDGGLHEIDLDAEDHDPQVCGCEYRGMNMWSCGHIDGEGIEP